MKLNPQDLEKIASLTLDHYNQRAEEFWQGTRDHDVKQNIAALLQWIEGKAPFTILDFGCGPGRDLKVFSELGHIAIGLEGAAHFVTTARTYSGCEVWLQNFLKLDLPAIILIACTPTHRSPNINTRNRKAMAGRAITIPNRFALMNRFLSPIHYLN